MTYQKSLSLVRNVLFGFAAVCLVVSCQEDETLRVSAADEATETSSNNEDGNVKTNISSLTITGENTVFAKNIVCNTCTYIVAKNTAVIDGKELGFKPGSIICLDKNLKYGDLTFINLEGTTENPITIGNCNGQ